MGVESLLNPIGMGIGLIGAVGKLFGNAKANRELRALQARDPKYVSNPIASQRLALAQTLLNARSPGSQTVERNIYSNAANSIAQINRNATDSSTALSLASGVSGQTNQAFNQLGLAEANDYQRRYQNYTGAQEGQINEDDKVYQDSIRRWQDDAQIGGSINANRQNTWGSISNLGFGIADFGMNGGFGGSGGGFGGGGRGTSSGRH